MSTFSTFSPFAILFWKVLFGTFILTIAIFKSINSKNAIIDIVFLSLKTIQFSTALLWFSLLLSHKRLDGMPIAPDFIGSTGGFPFTTFKYPVACLGHDVPPVDQWPTFFLNFAIIHLFAISIGAIISSRQSASNFPNILDRETFSETVDSNNSLFYSIALTMIIVLFNLFFLIVVRTAFD